MLRLCLMLRGTLGDGQLSMDEFKTLCAEMDKSAREVSLKVHVSKEFFG
jgi:hypothetical protein